MGGGRDKRKKAKERKDGPLPGKGADKTERKTQANESKKVKRAERALDGDEDDIDALLARVALEEQKRKAVTIEPDCAPPSARVNASFTSHTAPKVNDILLFGGEYCDRESDKVYVNNDLYRYSCDKHKWARISSPNSPPPRSAHQAFIYKGSLYVFGGEFTSPNQQKFHHYKDLWRLDLTTMEWDQLPLKGGPSARSGHRVAVYKHKAILFGGFYDNGRDVKYYNDLWELDLAELRWRPVGSSTGQQPSPRSGCQIAVAGDTLFLYGGYSKSPDDEDEDIEHGCSMDDMWALDLTKYTWEKVKRAGMAPGRRASFAMVPHRHRCFLFGGVADNEARGGEDLSSEFFNDLYIFNFDKRRWFAAELRQSKTAAAAAAAAATAVEIPAGADSDMPDASSGASGSGTAPTTAGGATAAPGEAHKELQSIVNAGDDRNSALYKAAVRIQAHFRGYVVRKAYKVYKIGGAISEILYSPAAFGLDMSTKNMPKPRARFSPQMCVVGNTLWLLGGIVEVGSKEITLDDMWQLDLMKLDGWQLVRENTVGEEVFKAGPAESSDEWEEASEEGA